MVYDFKKLSGSKIELSVSLSEEEFGPFLAKSLDRLTTHAELPGFRKGRAPKELVLQKYGELAMYEEAAEAAINEIFLKIAEEKKWEPIGKPGVTVKKLSPKHPFEFDVIFEIMPEVVIPEKYKTELKKMKKEKKPVVVDPKEVERSLDWLVRSRAEFSLSLEPARIKDWLTADLSLRHKGESVKNGQQNDFRFCLESDSLMPGFAEKLVGAKAGDKVSFSLLVPKDYGHKEIAGQEIDFEVLIKKVERENLPELDDALAKSLGKFPSLEALRQNISEGLMKEAEQKSRESFRLRILAKINDFSQIDLPQVMIDREKHNMVHELRSSIESHQLDWQAYLSQLKKTEQEIEAEFEDKAKERLRFALILEKIAEQEEIEPTQEEIELESNKTLSQFKNRKEAEQSIDVYQLTAYTRGILKNEKTSQFLEQLVEAE